MKVFVCYQDWQDEPVEIVAVFREREDAEIYSRQHVLNVAEVEVLDDLPEDWMKRRGL